MVKKCFLPVGSQVIIRILTSEDISITKWRIRIWQFWILIIGCRPVVGFQNIRVSTMGEPVLQGVPEGSALPRRGKNILRTQGKSADIYSFAVKHPLCSTQFFQKHWFYPLQIFAGVSKFGNLRDNTVQFTVLTHSMDPKKKFLPVLRLRPLCQTQTQKRIYYRECSFRYT